MSDSEMAFDQFLEREIVRLTSVKAQFMSRASRGWSRVWGIIAERYGDFACLHEGEVWQYMGSVSEDGSTWTHEFRHRAQPPAGERKYEKIPAEHDDFDEVGGDA